MTPAQSVAKNLIFDWFMSTSRIKEGEKLPLMRTESRLERIGVEDRLQWGVPAGRFGGPSPTLVDLAEDSTAHGHDSTKKTKKTGFT